MAPSREANLILYLRIGISGLPTWQMVGPSATVLRGTRVTLNTVLASLADGATVDEILKDFPTLTEVDVRAAIAFAAASAQEDFPIVEAVVR